MQKSGYNVKSQKAGQPESAVLTLPIVSLVALLILHPLKKGDFIPIITTLNHPLPKQSPYTHYRGIFPILTLFTHYVIMIKIIKKGGKKDIMSRPPKTKIIKTTVNTKDYQILTSIARLHNHRIWEELAIAIKQYISKYKLYDATAMTTAPAPATTQFTTTATPLEDTTDTQAEEIKRKIKIWVETFNISPMDTTMNTFEQCKKFIEGVLKRELTPGEIDITMFDEVQQERRENNGEASTFNATR